MPVYLVHLAAPAVYQPDHPRARREVTEFVVNAPDPQGAEIHAYRVLAGAIKITDIVEIQDKRLFRPAPIEDTPVPEPVAGPGTGMVGGF